MSAFARVLVAAAVLCLLLPGIACARRDPTPRERKEIVRAAARAEGGPNLAVRTHDVHISTAGPWAAADVDIYRRGTSSVMQGVLDSFVRVRGRWIDTAGAGAVDREPPRAVVRDLGLDPPAYGRLPQWLARSLHVALIALAVLAALGVLAVIGWGMEEGGVQRGGGAPGSSRRSSSSASYSSPPEAEKPRCNMCDGHGRRRCDAPGCDYGTVYEPGDWHHPRTSHRCERCHGHGLIPCGCGSH